MGASRVGGWAVRATFSLVSYSVAPAGQVIKSAAVKSVAIKPAVLNRVMVITSPLFFGPSLYSGPGGLGVNNAKSGTTSSNRRRDGKGKREMERFRES